MRLVTASSPSAESAQFHPAPMARRERLILLVLVSLALAARVFYAWHGQWSTISDRGVVNLMALHMAEGRAFPIFFYGQGYMGSLEPALGALFVLLFGASGFTVALGTAIPAALLVAPLYFLGRRMAGPVAGLLAAASFVIGSEAFVAYMSSPRGGYAMTLLLNALVLLIAARLAERAWKREATRLCEWSALGLVGGLDWWIGPMAVPALGAAGLALAVALRGRVWHPGVLCALAGFLAGAAPWIAWNAGHDWGSLSMADSLQAAKPSEALGLLARRAWDGLGWGAPDVSYRKQLAFLAAGTGAAMAAGVWRARRERDAASAWVLAQVTVYLALFCAAYASSTFSRTETLRYVLPLLPALALVLGLAGALLARLHRSLALVALALIVGPHVYAHRKGPEPDPRRERVEAAPEFARVLRAEGVDAVFAEYPHHWINFAARGALPVVEPTSDCVPLNDRAGLLAGRPAFYRIPSLKHFRSLARVSQRAIDTPLGHVSVDLAPDPQRYSMARAGQVTALTDGNLATGWSARSVQGESAPERELVFDRPLRVAGVMIFSRRGDYPMYVALDGRSATEGTWRNLVPDTLATDWFWSGPQLYCRDLYQALELRCAPAEVTALRLRLPPSPNRSHYAFHVDEVLVLHASDDMAPASRPDVDELVNVCRSRAVQRIYANRWIADRIAARRLPALSADHSGRLDRRSSDPRDEPARFYSPITNVAGVGFFSAPGAIAHNLGTLEEAGIAVDRVAVSGGELLVVTAAPPAAISLAWMGDVLLRKAEDR